MCLLRLLIVIERQGSRTPVSKTVSALAISSHITQDLVGLNFAGEGRELLTRSLRGEAGARF